MFLLKDYSLNMCNNSVKCIVSAFLVVVSTATVPAPSLQSIKKLSECVKILEHNLKVLPYSSHKTTVLPTKKHCLFYGILILTVLFPVLARVANCLILISTLTLKCCVNILHSFICNAKMLCSLVIVVMSLYPLNEK
jgi:hypothetical protein